MDFVVIVSAKDGLHANDILRSETFGLCVMRGNVPCRPAASGIGLLLVH